MIYIEFVSRRPGVALEDFHKAWNDGQEGWGGDYEEDLLVWSGARTWRLGPEPEYLAVWYVPHAGFDRLDDWDRIFKSGDADPFEDPFHAAARIDFGGCYESLIEPTKVKGKRYYVELFRPNGPDEDIVDHYEKRAAGGSHELLVLARRIGKLAPEPGGLAVWGMDAFADLQGVAEALDGVSQPVELVAAGVYADVGQEEL